MAAPSDGEGELEDEDVEDEDVKEDVLLRKMGDWLRICDASMVVLAWVFRTPSQESDEEDEEAEESLPPPSCGVRCWWRFEGDTGEGAAALESSGESLSFSRLLSSTILRLQENHCLSVCVKARTSTLTSERFVCVHYCRDASHALLLYH